MACRLNKEALRDRTEEYWECKSACRCDYDCYIEELLGRELAYADDHPLSDGTPRLRRLLQPIHTLVLTVGESFEPLLQVECVLQPRRLVLILNRTYGTTSGLDHGETLCRWIRHLANAPDLRPDYQPTVEGMDFEIIQIREDSPTGVFRAICDTMRRPESTPPDGRVNAADITGAKKSMVVGAFLYAAHSGLPITYVDFDEFHPRFGRPYGYLCRIGQIANPYQAFALNDWERVRQLFSQYNFRGAQELIGSVGEDGKPGSGILAVMSGHLDQSKEGRTLYDPQDTAKVERLVSLLRLYENWDSGEYRLAKKLADAFEPALPADLVPWTIPELGEIWPSAIEITDAGEAALHLLKEHLDLKRGEKAPADSIFGQPARLLAYVRDELSKIDRLISRNEDYRSAYLRAAALHEFLLKARLALCWLNGGLEARPKGSEEWQAVSAFGELEHAAFESLVEESSEWKLRKTLESTPPEKFDVSGGSIRRAPNAPQLQGYGQGLKLDLTTAVYGEGQAARPVFVKLRGEAIHTHLYIPRHVAKAAWRLVDAAVHEFEAQWLDYFFPGKSLEVTSKLVKCSSWHRLCQILELEFLPPKLRE